MVVREGIHPNSGQWEDGIPRRRAISNDCKLGVRGDQFCGSFDIELVLV
jgi:hypothetical protein